MRTPADDLSADQEGTISADLSAPTPWPGHADIERQEPRNLVVLAAHQIVLRVGWIFKTESVIMPAFLDTIAGAGWLRGCLPVLNRFGQSVPPVLYADRLRTARYKKRVLATCVMLMALPFAILATVWFAIGGQHRVWMPGLFLVLYAAFFVANGLYHLSFGTVQGKLIRPTQRGRLLKISTFYGSFPAMLLAWLLLDRWLSLPDGGFGRIFALSAVCFFLSGLMVLFVFEPADAPQDRSTAGRRGGLRETWTTLRADRNLVRLVLVAMLFGSGLIIFPHYQALARDELGLAGVQLVFWVITQNASVGLFSLVIGPLADAWGNRLTLRVLVFTSAIAPLFAASLPRFFPGLGLHLFWLVFIPLGVVPLVLRILANYALEICEPDDHPRYLSTVSLCLAVPFLFSPVVGWLIDMVGFEVIFFTTAGLIALGGSVTFRLEEPRRRVVEDKLALLEAGGDE